MRLFKNIIPGPVASMMREVEGLRLKTREQINEGYQTTLFESENQRIKAKAEKQKSLFEVANQEEIFTRNENLADIALNAIDSGNMRPIKLAKNRGNQTWNLFCQSGALARAIEKHNAVAVIFLLNNEVDYKLNKEYEQALVFKSCRLVTPAMQEIYNAFVKKILIDLPNASKNDQITWFLDAMMFEPKLLNNPIPEQHGFTPAMQLARDNHLAELTVIYTNSEGLFEPIVYSQRDDSGKTIFDYAFIHGHKELSLWLVEKANLQLSPIEKACIHGNLVEIDRLLAIKDGSVDPATRGNAPLLWAVMHNQHEIVARLIASNRIDIKANDNIAIITAVRYGYLEIAKQLIDVGADITAQNDLALKFANLNLAIASNNELLNVETKANNALNVFTFVYRARCDAEKNSQQYKARTVMNVQYLWKNYQIRTEEAKERTQLTTAANELYKLNSYVVNGQQEEAEIILRQNIYLASMPVDITDVAGRKFKQITCFQYAVWALDYYMWTMISNYLTDEQIRVQLADFNSAVWIAENGIHGTQVSWQELIDALEKFVNTCRSWSEPQCRGHWISAVGGAQLKLPAHVIQEYMRENKVFDCNPPFDVDERRLIRSKIGDQWFKPLGCYTLGVNIAWFGYGPNYNAAGPTAWEGWQIVAGRAKENLPAARSLFEIRSKQRAQLVDSVASMPRPSI